LSANTLGYPTSCLHNPMLDVSAYPQKLIARCGAYREFAMKYTVLIVTLLVIAGGTARAQKPADQSKTMVYDDITKGSSTLDHDANNAYAGKFRLIDIRQSDGFAPSSQPRHDASGRSGNRGEPLEFRTSCGDDGSLLAAEDRQGQSSKCVPSPD